MTFQLWCQVILSSGDQGDDFLKAKLHNIATEDRIPGADDFRRSVGIAFSGGGTLVDAERAVNTAVQPLFDETCALLGLIQTDSTDHGRFHAVSFVTGRQIERNIIRTFDASASTLPQRVALPERIFAHSPRRFVWATFAEEVDGLSPTDIAVSLGLPHFLSGQAVYQINLGDWPRTVYVPTCMDSGAYEAWKRPSTGHSAPWGMTRHLVSGVDCKPEILIDITDLSGRDLVAVRLGSRDERVGNYPVNFLVGRDFSGIAA